jgi:hypothetical protein
MKIIFILALIAGVFFALPVGEWLKMSLRSRLHFDANSVFILQVLGDLTLICLLIFSIAATASAAFMPGLYGSF